MNRKVKVSLYISVIATSLSLLLSLSIYTFIHLGFPYRTDLLLPCIPSPFAFVGLCAICVLGFFVFKTDYSHKWSVVFSLVCFLLLAVSIECFTCIAFFQYRKYLSIKGWSYFIPSFFAILAIVFAVLTKVGFHRRPPKVKQLEQQVAELQQQVDELKKDNE